MACASFTHLIETLSNKTRCMKFLKLSIILLLVSSACSMAVAQSRSGQSSRENVPQSFDRGATYETGSSKKAQKSKKKSKYSLAGEYDKKVEEYHKRMEANVKKYNKMAKEMEKPQYSDPTYFGHKKPPKKRPVGKKKFCKECGMSH
jgi:hypothetical protein